MWSISQGEVAAMLQAGGHTPPEVQQLIKKRYSFVCVITVRHTAAAGSRRCMHADPLTGYCQVCVHSMQQRVFQKECTHEEWYWFQKAFLLPYPNLACRVTRHCAAMDATGYTSS